MALTIAKLKLESGLELTNPLIIISELNTSNNSSQSQRLEIASTPAEGQAERLNQEYSLNTSKSGGTYCNYMVSVFLNKEAFDTGKPPVEQLKDNRSIKVFSLNLDGDEYKDLTPRKAAYAHLKKQDGFVKAEEVENLEV
ncbi:MAG: hypothetical protein ACPGUD_14610 [Parashewanella sp.]